MRAMLKEKRITEPTTVQLKDATEKVEEELHAILFLNKMDKSKYGKFIKEMENNVLQSKYPFQRQSLMHAGSLQDGKNRYANKDSKLTKENDGVAFATTGNEEQ